jgi:diaminohydroxyphosphoribosylaminopyrimidine deaminase/5-amino-6-(5-phosphoribosylamino)uracil reductase
MREAIELSKMGFPAPNPRVGAVVVKDGEVVARGFHEAAGQPHAEVVALSSAGSKAKGSDLYVTLEPCAHEGKTPPCTLAILDHCVARVIYAVDDPNPAAAGGADFLREHSVHVEAGLLREAAAAENRIFLSRFLFGRPYVMVKSAISLDGRIATPSGESKWITGEAARERARALRAEFGCVLVGATTVERDNPSLLARIDGVAPLRVILDPSERLDGSKKVFSGGGETLRVVRSGSGKPGTYDCPYSEGEFDLDNLLGYLAEMGMIGVLVEGGGRTAATFFRQRLVDEVELHIAGKAFGSGPAWLGGRGDFPLAEAYKISSLKAEALGDDIRIWGKVQS